mmetsp:Transcript_40160/g.89100  ORF Transcript_40160/g.89100 Transcript_40160/m.89100 type:complete len:205 (+) Transcript_40160:93-707(+)
MHQPTPYSCFVPGASLSSGARCKPIKPCTWLCSTQTSTHSATQRPGSSKRPRTGWQYKLPGSTLQAQHQSGAPMSPATTYAPSGLRKPLDITALMSQGVPVARRSFHAPELSWSVCVHTKHRDSIVGSRTPIKPGAARLHKAARVRLSTATSRNAPNMLTWFRLRAAAPSTPSSIKLSTCSHSAASGRAPASSTSEMMSRTNLA